MNKYTLQEAFKIRDAWNILRELCFLQQYISIDKFQDISNDISYIIDELQKGGELR